ncbi:MAG: PP2C family protein-serine/threonine phosphatase [Planctomycetota bacterium]|nr:PP2C family protein-serine/threonine phosphatase [Planctomycetota bacterium]
MPSAKPLLFVADHESVRDACRLSCGLEAHWCDGPCPTARILDTGCASADLEVGRFSLVVALIDAHTERIPRRIDQVVQAAVQQEVPVVLIGDLAEDELRGQPEQVLTLPESTSPEILAPYLAGIIGRDRRLGALVREHELTQRLVGNIHREIGQIDAELQSAAIVQREFMPRRMPTIGAVSASALWRPSTYVSGDFYQAVRIDDRRMGLLLADAAGHGVGSALMTIVMARAFSPSAEDGSCSPARVLSEINQALVQIQGGRMQFATGIYVVIDCIDGSLSYACAGHPAPLLLDDCCMKPLGMDDAGPALGIFEDAEYKVMHGQLDEAQSILLYSDGFEHAFPSPQSDVTDLQTPNNAYLDVFRSLSDLKTTPQMVERIEQVIDGRRGSLQPFDDLTLLCARRSPVPACTVGPSGRFEESGPR